MEANKKWKWYFNQPWWFIYRYIFTFGRTTFISRRGVQLHWFGYIVNYKWDGDLIVAGKIGSGSWGDAFSCRKTIFRK